MTRYVDFRRHMFTLWKEETAGWAVSEWERKRLVESVTDTITNAELKWPGDGDGAHSISGGEHLRDHLAHDWNLTERDEIRFRQWFLKVTVHGFGNKPLNQQKAA